jgi:hypothetical protein
MSFTRFLLFLLVGSFIVMVACGILGPASWDWKRMTFFSLSIFSLYIVMVSTDHYLESHIWEHIIKRHLFRIFLWSFGALLLIKLGFMFGDFQNIIQNNMLWVLLIAALMGIVPESGPHLLFVMLYTQDLIPFSVLFTASFVQDGHGMLPLLSYSIRDSLLIKGLNLIFGLTLGVILFTFGL